VPGTDTSKQPAPELPFNVRPCLRDPLFGLLKDRWRLPPWATGMLFLAVYFGGNFLCSWLSGTAFPRDGLALSFTQDTIALALYLFLIPIGALLAMRFFEQVESTFERLYSDGVIRADVGEYNTFLRRLDAWYNSTSLHVCALGAAVAIHAYLTAVHQSNGVRDWLDVQEGIGGAYDLVTGLIAWYAVHIVVLKLAITALGINRAFGWPVNIQPTHPDGCGGFRLFTDMAVTIALFAAALGAGVVLIILADSILHDNPPSAGPIAVAALVESLTPLLFVTCLYRAHQEMKTARERMMRQIHEQFHRRFVVLQEKLARGELSHESNEEMLQLDALHGLVRRLPVWPTNTQMVAQIVMSVALPLGLLALQLAVERAFIGSW
jgi:hypothetical protein